MITTVTICDGRVIGYLTADEFAKLKSSIASRKIGNRISKEDLEEFAQNYSKKAITLWKQYKNGN